MDTLLPSPRSKPTHYPMESEGTHHCMSTTGAREGQRFRQTHLRKATESNPDHSRQVVWGSVPNHSHILILLSTPQQMTNAIIPPPPPMGTQLVVLCLTGEGTRTGGTAPLDEDGGTAPKDAHTHKTQTDTHAHTHTALPPHLPERECIHCLV